MLAQCFATWLWALLPARQSKRPSAAGQGLIEYAFLLALIALVVIVVLYIFGQGVKDGLYENIVLAL